MHTGLKITAFAAGLAATFGSAYAVGGALDPAVAATESSHQDGHGAKDRPATEEGAVEKSVGEAPELPGGLQISQGATPSTSAPRASRRASPPSCASPSWTRTPPAR